MSGGLEYAIGQQRPPTQSIRTDIYLGIEDEGNEIALGIAFPDCSNLECMVFQIGKSNLSSLRCSLRELEHEFRSLSHLDRRKRKRGEDIHQGSHN